ncbi:hypothetical protein XENOCAPTIV_025187 [Xenoophorus captivus]|uniref:Uncharacterized protein n=1 Tax=Xenoophorus captivus TaxID=1517983 RepID=A0ABV0QBK1_9TELE
MGKMCFQPSFPILLSEYPSVHTSFLPALPLIPNDSLCLLSFFHVCFISPPSSPFFLVSLIYSSFVPLFPLLCTLFLVSYPSSICLSFNVSSPSSFFVLLLCVALVRGDQN